jgi:hypothetical protein
VVKGREISDMTEFYCKCSPNSTASCGNIQTALDCDDDWSPRAIQTETDAEFDAARPLMIDITPVGCSTPKGAARVAKAIKDFVDAGAALANAAIEFFDTHESDILHAMEMYPGVAEDVHQLQALIGARNRKQGAFLAAVVGQ